jgi:altronate dehydratase
MQEPLTFDSLARLPADGDNVAICTRPLEAGTVVAYEGNEFPLSHTLLEGHRFAAGPIAKGDSLLSWGLPFGKASRDIEPGEYVCNEKILTALAERHVAFEIPGAANFADHLEPYQLDAGTFIPGEQVTLVDNPGTFRGFARPGKRGVGTRNFIVVLGTTSRAGPFAEAVAARFASVADEYDNIDGVVAVAHTEGGGKTAPNNLDFVLRTLTGFMVHPNVGAVLAVDFGSEGYTNDDVSAFATEHDYPLAQVPHAFMRVSGSIPDELNRAQELVASWLPQVGAMARTDQPLKHLKLALQCGGSDAFSGISGNALAGWIAKALIENGGSANLAETDELIGAEPYMLSNVRDAETAQRFLDKIDIFKARAALHGASAEGNPSGGNNYRGLYNIALKSIGAARKRDPDVRLDKVIDYAEPMDMPGYYFMDSPGNDLESIAGQVAAGSNIIIFITGNGSITNFPFVPTLKFVTTTGRFQMLANEMDVNAGRYNDGMSMDELGEETFGLARAIASGQPSKGELAGHAQVSIWRNWRQTEAGRVTSIRAMAQPDGEPLPTSAGLPLSLRYDAVEGAAGKTTDQLGLIMPTSLCSGQIAKLIATQMNKREQKSASTRRYVALVHTEGCGSVNAEDLYLRTMLGHLRHPFIRSAVMLEHGCEKVHNDAVKNYLVDEGEDISRFGWASVQLDGGLMSVSAKVAEWFDDHDATHPPPPAVEAGIGDIRIALLGSGAMSAQMVSTFAQLGAALAQAGATVVVANNANFALDPAFARQVLADGATYAPTLPYGGRPDKPGFHVMDMGAEDELETVSGIGAAGVEIMLNYVGDAPSPSHPMVPMIQVSGEPAITERYGDDLDLVLSASDGVEASVRALASLIERTASGAHTPMLRDTGTTGFQLSRGALGISL